MLALALTTATLGITPGTFGQLDLDTLRPVGPTIGTIREVHTAPVLSPSGRRYAMGVSMPHPSNRGPRVGLVVGTASPVAITHHVPTGIATEAVVHPSEDVVGGLTQAGTLIVVDARTGRIRSRKGVGYGHCTASAVQTRGAGVVLNEARRDAVELASVDSRGRVRTATVRLGVDAPAEGCRRAPLVAAGDRAFVVGSAEVLEVEPATLRVTRHPLGVRTVTTSAAPAAGGIVLAGARGARFVDTRTWRTRWRDVGVGRVAGDGGTTVLVAANELRARTADGRRRWRLAGSDVTNVTVRHGRAYVYDLTRMRVVNLATGAVRATHRPDPYVDLAAEKSRE